MIFHIQDDYIDVNSWYIKTLLSYKANLWLQSTKDSMTP